MSETKDTEAVSPASLAQQIPPTPPTPAEPPVPTASQEQPEQLRVQVSGPAESSTSPSKTSTRRRRSAKKPSSELQAMLPKNERIHVWKRTDDGKLAFASDYGQGELKGFGSIEAFLRKYVVPKFGFGEYHLYLQSENGQPQPIGQVSLLAPAEKPSGDVTTLKELLEASQRMSDQAKNEGGSMFDGMAKMMGILKDLKGDDGKGGVDPMALFMLMQMNRSEHPRGPDPMVQLLAQKLDQLEERTREAAAMPMPPMPPPAPPIDPMASMAPLVTGVLETMSKLVEVSSRPAPAPPQRDVLAELASMKTLFDRGDSLGPKDVIQMLPTLKELIGGNQAPPQDLGTQLASIKESVNSLRSIGAEIDGPQQSDSFWPVAAQILSLLTGQPNLGPNVAQAIQDEVTGNKPPEQLQKPQEEQEDHDLQIPDGFLPFAEKINTSENIGEKIGATVMGLQFLHQEKEWQPYVIAILTKVQEDKKRKALELLGAFFSGMVEIEVIERDAAMAVLEGIRDHWTTIRSQMGLDKPAPKPGRQPPQQVAEGAGDAEDTEGAAPGNGAEHPAEVADDVEESAGGEGDGVEVIEEDENGEIDPSDIIEADSEDVVQPVAN